MAKKKQSPQQQLTPQKYIKEKARSLPIAECFIGKNWEFAGQTNIAVARRHVQGTYTLGVYLVDTFCKGLVDSIYHFSLSEDDYRYLLERMEEVDEIVNIEYTQAHNLIYGAIAFAEEAGIRPHNSFELTRYILEEDTEDIPLIEYEFGKNGKHFLLAKSGLDASKYFPSLQKNLGENFTYFIGEGFDEDDEVVELQDVVNMLSARIKDRKQMPETPYLYEYPEYPAVLALENQFLAPLFYSPKSFNNFPEAMITKVLSCSRESLIRDLEQIILFEIGCTCIEIPEERMASEFYSPSRHAVFFLGELGHTGSLDVVLELLRQNSEFCDYHFGDTMGEIFIPTLYLLGKDQLSALFQYMKEPGLYTFARYQVLPAVALIARRHPECRAEVVEWFRQLLVFYADTIASFRFCDGSLAGLLMGSLIDIRAVELLPEIKGLFDTGYVDYQCCGDYQKVENKILSGMRALWRNYSFEIYERYREYEKRWCKKSAN